MRISFAASSSRPRARPRSGPGFIAAFDPFDHDALRRARADRLGRLGLSAAKIKTLKNLAREIAAERVNLDVLANEDADAAHHTLISLHGIGPWTADVYLLFCLGHGDAWPAGDLAVQEAVKIGLGLKTRPTAKQMIPLAEPWRPMRGAAAHLWWSYYRATQEARRRDRGNRKTERRFKQRSLLQNAHSRAAFGPVSKGIASSEGSAAKTARRGHRMLDRTDDIATSAANWLAEFERALERPDDDGASAALSRRQLLARRAGAELESANAQWRRRDPEAASRASPRAARPAVSRSIPTARRPRRVKRAGTEAIEAIFKFETEQGRGHGIVRLIPDTA